MKRSVAAAALLATACAAPSHYLPLKEDHYYPHGWLQLEGLGANCTRIKGTYRNEGVAVDEQGNRANIRLTEALPIWPPFHGAAQLVSLEYVVKSDRKDRFSGEAWTIGQLLASADGITRPVGSSEPGCFCTKQTLVCALGIHWEQHNIYIARSSDGALVAKLQIQPFGVPGKEPWVKFQRIGD